MPKVVLDGTLIHAPLRFLSPNNMVV
jgi:hypothetical protein